MRKANWHTYQILTKRPEKMQELQNLMAKVPRPHLVGYLVWTISLQIKNRHPSKYRSQDSVHRLPTFAWTDREGRSVWDIMGYCRRRKRTQAQPISPDWVRGRRDQCKQARSGVLFQTVGRPYSESGRKDTGRSNLGRIPLRRSQLFWQTGWTSPSESLGHSRQLRLL